MQFLSFLQFFDFLEPNFLTILDIYFFQMFIFLGQPSLFLRISENGFIFNLIFRKLGLIRLFRRILFEDICKMVGQPLKKMSCGMRLILMVLTIGRDLACAFSQDHLKNFRCCLSSPLTCFKFAFNGLKSSKVGSINSSLIQSCLELTGCPSKSCFNHIKQSLFQRLHSVV